MRKKCVQPVLLARQNKWHVHPQPLRKLWMNQKRLVSCPSPLFFFHQTVRQFHTGLPTGKKPYFTDTLSAFSTLSTPPTITTTIYI